MKNNSPAKPLSSFSQTLNSLKKQAPKLLAEVNYLLTEAGKINEAIIVIGPPQSGKSSILKTLALNNHYEHFSLNDKELEIRLPERFKIKDKVFWECSNKINPNMIEKESILQVLVNIFFIKNLIEVSDKLKFIIVVKEKATINDTIDSFTSIIRDFISIFPNEEHIKLKENVICVVTQFNKNNQEQFLESLNSKIGVLEYFPKLLTNLKYLYAPKTQNDSPILSLKLEDNNILSETKININKLNLFLGVQETFQNNSKLIKILYDQIQPNVNNIYNIIKSIFTEENFDIYKPRDCSKFLERHNYKNYVQKFFSKSNHSILEKKPLIFKDYSNCLSLKKF